MYKNLLTSSWSFIVISLLCTWFALLFQNKRVSSTVCPLRCPSSGQTWSCALWTALLHTDGALLFLQTTDMLELYTFLCSNFSFFTLDFELWQHCTYGLVKFMQALGYCQEKIRFWLPVSVARMCENVLNVPWQTGVFKTLHFSKFSVLSTLCLCAKTTWLGLGQHHDLANNNLLWSP